MPKQEWMEEERPNRGCHWRGCPMPGSLSDNTRGGGPFFCRWHFWTRADPKVANQITYQMEHGEIILEKKDWRDRMMDDLMAGKVKPAEESQPRNRRGYMPPEHEDEADLLESLKGLYSSDTHEQESDYY